VKTLEVIAFNYQAARQQLEEFRSFLGAHTGLSERDDLLPFFRARPQLAFLLGMFNPRIARPDRIAWEFDIFGDFACDLVIGEWAEGEYCFVEFEDATEQSIFEKQGKKATREWGRRFDHGYSQIIDWIHKLASRAISVDLLGRFGRHEIRFETVLIIGRDQHLDAGEAQRLAWRADNVLVNTTKVHCVTYDDLLGRLSRRLHLLSVAAAVPPTAPATAQSPPPAKPDA